MSPYLTIASKNSDGSYKVVAALVRPDNIDAGDFVFAAITLRDSLCPTAEILKRQDLPTTITPDHQTDIARDGE